MNTCFLFLWCHRPSHGTELHSVGGLDLTGSWQVTTYKAQTIYTEAWHIMKCGSWFMILPFPRSLVVSERASVLSYQSLGINFLLHSAGVDHGSKKFTFALLLADLAGTIGWSCCCWFCCGCGKVCTAWWQGSPALSGWRRVTKCESFHLVPLAAG